MKKLLVIMLTLGLMACATGPESRCIGADDTINRGNVMVSVRVAPGINVSYNMHSTTRSCPSPVTQ